MDVQNRARAFPINGERVLPWLFLAPALLSIVVFRLIPVGWMIRQSFTDRAGEFVGLENFRFLFSLPSFSETIRTTLLYIGITVPFQITAAFALALLLTQPIPGSSFFRALIFIPVAVPGAVSAILWGAMFRQDGLANAILGAIGIGPLGFIRDPNQALISIVIVTSWIGIGFWMVFLVGGLLDIPSDLYEAAALDGGGWLSNLLNLTIPMMRRPLAFVIVADTAAASLLYAPIAILTRGGPGGSTNVVMYDVYQQAFFFDDISLASAEALLLMVVLVLVVGIQFKLLTRD